MIPVLIGLSGLSGAGKTTVAEHLERQGGIKRFRFDAFYKDESECPKIGERPHWDLPKSLHLDRALDALQELRKGNEIWLPIYNRKENRCTGKSIYQPAPIIFAEGLMLFSDERIRNLFDLRLWLEVSEEEALRRRLLRQPDYDVDYHWRVAAPAAREFAVPHRAAAHAIIDGAQTEHEVASETDVIIHKFLGI
jgi:uridine kinase